MQLRLKTIVNSRNVHEWYLYMVIEDYTAVEKKKLVTTVFWLNLYYSSIVALFPENRIVFFNILRKVYPHPYIFETTYIRGSGIAFYVSTSGKKYDLNHTNYSTSPNIDLWGYRIK